MTRRIPMLVARRSRKLKCAGGIAVPATPFINQGFDALVALYNQPAGLWNVQGEAANMALGLRQELLAKDPSA